MTIAELSQCLKEFLEIEGCRIEDDSPGDPGFAAVHPSTGLSFVFDLPGDAAEPVDNGGVELQVGVPLLDWAALRCEAEAEAKDALACQDSLPSSANSLGYVRDAQGKPMKITLQGSTGIQTMGEDDENDVRLLLESLALDSLDAAEVLKPFLKAEGGSQDV